MQRLLILLWLIVPLVGASPLQARTLGGVDLPEQVVLESDGSRLLLNGAGVVRHLFTDLLVGALYLPQRQGDAGRLISLPEPARVQLYVLYQRIEVADLEAAWLACLENSSGLEQGEYLMTRLRALLRLIPGLQRGDVLAVDLYPGQGARLYLNGRLRGSVAGDEISRALLVAWIGDSPLDNGVKRAMLGRS